MLSIEGGALRIHLTNQILKELEAQIKNYYLRHRELLPPEARNVRSSDELEVQLADHVTCIGGVSAGAWTGLYYASKGGNGAVAALFEKPAIIKKYGHLYPGAAAGLDVFFEEYGKHIYPPSLFGYRLPRFRVGFFKFSVDIPGINSPVFSAEGLENALQTFFGDTKLSDLHTSMVVHAYDVNHRTPILFTFNTEVEPPRSAATLVHASSPYTLRGTDMVHEVPAMTDIGRFDIFFEDFLIRDVGRGSSALPAIHIAKEISPIGMTDKTYLCIDGALASISPTPHSLNFMERGRDVSDIKRIASMSFEVGTAIGRFADNVGSGIGWLLSGDLFDVLLSGGSAATEGNLYQLVYRLMDPSEGQFRTFQVHAERGSGYEHALTNLFVVKYIDDYRKIGKGAAEHFREDLQHFVEHFIFATEAHETPAVQPANFRSVFTV